MRKTNIISVVSISYRSYPELSQSLPTLAKLKAPVGYKLKFIIIDGGTIPTKLRVFEKKYPQFEYHANEENFGVGKAFNMGIKHAFQNDAEYILLATADLVVSSSHLSTLLRLIKSDPKIGAVSGKLLFDTKPNKVLFVSGKLDKRVKSTIHDGAGEVDRGQYSGVVESEILNCPILVRASVIKEVGLFREDYFMYYEDTDFYTRIRKAGYKLVVDRSVVAYTDYPKGDEEALTFLKKHYYNARNLLYFISYNFSLKEKLIAYVYIAKNSLPLIMSVLLNKKRKEAYYKLLGIKDFLFEIKGMKTIQ